jgi:hypothetical protein
MPDNFHKMLLLFFTHCYKQKKSLHHGKQV